MRQIFCYCTKDYSAEPSYGQLYAPDMKLIRKCGNPEATPFYKFSWDFGARGTHHVLYIASHCVLYIASLSLDRGTPVYLSA